MLLFGISAILIEIQSPEGRKDMTMNKGELINAVAANGLTKKDAEVAINAVFGAIGDALAKGKPSS